MRVHVSSGAWTAQQQLLLLGLPLELPLPLTQTPWHGEKDAGTHWGKPPRLQRVHASGPQGQRECGQRQWIHCCDFYG